jgi:membrane-bound lytic murein transglycosylase D
MLNRVDYRWLVVSLFAILLASCSAREVSQRLSNEAADDAATGTTTEISREEDTPFTGLESDDIEGLTEPEDRFWQQVGEDFKLHNAVDQPRVQRELQWYRCHNDFLQRVTARAEPFLYYLLQQTQARDMPAELILLPIVESPFLPYAHSPSGAAGMWQFMPATARHYGLRQNWWYDGRRDVVDSTRAALDYLQRLHGMFDGDWLLALAAYNSGVGNVRAAIRHNRKQGLPTDFWHLDLPKETRRYVPKLLAIKAIVENPHRYGLELWPIPNHPVVKAAKLDGQIDLSLAARLAGIPPETLYALNPGFRRWASPPHTEHLLLPVKHVAQFTQALAELPATQRVSWRRHRVKTGESLSVIAQRFGTRVSDIKRVNHLKNNLIRAGEKLLVPLPAVKTAGTADSGADLPRTLIHVVESGDSLWSIAQFYNTSIQAIRDWNDIERNTPLYPGMQLKIERPQLAGNHS